MKLDSYLSTDMVQLKSDFERSGICHVSNVFKVGQVEKLRLESDRLWERQATRTASNLRIGLREDLNNNIVMDRLDPVADISRVFDQLNKDKVLTGLAEYLLGQKVQVMKEKLIFKRPGTGGFGLHRDEPYFGSSGAHGGEMATFTVLLDDFIPQNGPIQFYPQLRMRKLRAPDNESRDIAVTETAEIEPLVPLARAGDILIFDGLIPHRSSFNRSAAPRRVYMVTYIPARYQNGREKYYRQRLIEQREERSKADLQDFIFR